MIKQEGAYRCAMKSKVFVWQGVGELCKMISVRKNYAMGCCIHKMGETR